MAYNSYYPATYQPMGYYPPVYQQAQAQPQMPRIQQSGFVPVQSEAEARSYPVAPGNSVTFKDESGPFCYVKTMGFNSLDRPTFERYRLVKEDAPQDAQEGAKTSESAEGGIRVEYALKSEFDALRAEVEALKAKEGVNDAD